MIGVSSYLQIHYYKSKDLTVRYFVHFRKICRKSRVFSTVMTVGTLNMKGLVESGPVFHCFLIALYLPGKFTCHNIFKHAELFLLYLRSLLNTFSLAAGDTGSGVADGGILILL